MLELSNLEENRKGKEIGKSSENDELELLVLRVKQGDMKAFGKVYDLLVDKVYKYIYFKVDKESAFDLTETVFLKIWENIGKYNHQVGNSFSSWVFRIAHNLVVDYYRFNKETLPLDTEIVDQNKSTSPIEFVEQSLSKDNLKSALERLKTVHQEVLTLSFLNGLSNEEVAQIMGKNEGSLRVLKFRALQELKKVLLERGIKY